jgi:hypothetical protein
MQVSVCPVIEVAQYYDTFNRHALVLANSHALTRDYRLKLKNCAVLQYKSLARRYQH